MIKLLMTIFLAITMIVAFSPVQAGGPDYARSCNLPNEPSMNAEELEDDNRDRKLCLEYNGLHHPHLDIYRGVATKYWHSH